MTAMMKLGEEQIVETLLIIQKLFITPSTSQNPEDQNIQYNFTSYFVRMWNMVTFFEGKTHITDVWKQNAQEKFGSKKNEINEQFRILHKIYIDHTVLLRQWNLGYYNWLGSRLGWGGKECVLNSGGKSLGKHHLED
jgi:hypothetical protein